MDTLKKILLICSCLCLIGSCAGLTFAYTAAETPTLLYDGRAKSLTVLNTQENDLFENIKDLMPGDVRTQEISLQAENLTGDASIWLKADCDENTAQILNELTLSVYADDRLISSGPAGSGGQLGSGVQLYEFTDNRSVPLRVELSVPTEAGNELADVQEHLQWIFTVQDASGTDVVPPQTGENSNVILWVCLLLLSGGVLGALVYKIRRK